MEEEKEIEEIQKDWNNDNNAHCSWLMTWNNYTEADVERLNRLEKGEIKYICFAKEVGESGTPHLQGVIQLEGSKAKKKPGVLKLLDFENWQNTKCWILPMKAENIFQAINYCKKGEQSKEEWKEFKINGPNYGLNVQFYQPMGEPNLSKKNGWVNPDIVRYTECKDFIKNCGKQNAKKTLYGVFEQYPDIFFKHPQGVKLAISITIDKVKDDEVFESYENFKPLPWQTRVLEILKGPVNQREIIWVHDDSDQLEKAKNYQGRYGKSYFAKYLNVVHEADFFNNIKTADAAHMWNRESVCLFNFPKCMANSINYGLIEAIKDGHIASPKYNGIVKASLNPHVVVFANCKPSITAFSNDDRIKEIVLTPKDRMEFN